MPRTRRETLPGGTGHANDEELALIVGTVAAMSQASAQEANAQGVVMQRNMSLAMAKQSPKPPSRIASRRATNLGSGGRPRRTGAGDPARRAGHAADSGDGPAEGLHRAHVSGHDAGVSETHDGGSGAGGSARSRRYPGPQRWRAGASGHRHDWGRRGSAGSTLEVDDACAKAGVAGCRSSEVASWCW